LGVSASGVSTKSVANRAILNNSKRQTFCFSSRGGGSKTGCFWADVGRVPGAFYIMNTKLIVVALVAAFFSLAPVVHAQDAKNNGAEALNFSRETFSKIHMVVIAKLEFEAPPAAEFQYDRYPAKDGGAERIKSGEGTTFARKDGKTWLVSDDWGETGKPVDAPTAKRLNNWISVIDSLLNSQAQLKFVASKDAGQRDEVVFEEEHYGKGKAPRFTFDKYKNDKEGHPPLLSEFSGPMTLGSHEANVDVKFSYLVSVQITDVNEHPPRESPSPSPTPSVYGPFPKTVIQKKDDNSELINRGIEKGKRHDLKGAIADFTKAIQLDPSEAKGYANRAYARQLKKDVSGALADYNKALELDPQNADSYYARGNLKAENHDLNGAIADYDRTIELRPNHSHAYYNRAVAKKEKGDKAGSDADFKRAGEIDPQLAPPTVNTVTLLDGKFKIDIPSDFKREPDDPKEPKTLAKFSHNGEGGAWGDVNRGTHGLTPEELEGYLNKRVAEYTKGFKWLPKNSHLEWLHKEIVAINGWKWADWSFVPVMEGKKDWRHNPVYTRNLTTSYKGQLLEVNFTTNLTTDPDLKDEIDKIIASMRLEE
jgi:tetratricopeptide (TPR) repeat protein